MKPGPDTEALLQSGVQHHVQNRLAEAERVYLDVLRRQPMHARALHLLGLIGLQSGQTERAVQLFDKAIAVRPDFFEAYDNRGTALYMLDRFEAAIASFDRALALRPGHAAAHANRANVLQALNRGEEALAGYDAALALAPASAEAHFGRGATLNALKRHEEALASHDRAIALHPGYAKAFEGRGIALHGLGRLEESIAGYDRAIALNPRFAEALFGRAVALAASERNEEAVASYDQATALKPDFAEAFNNRAVPLLKLGRPEQALASLDRAVALKPAYAAAHTHRGNALHALRRPDEALASHDRAIALQPDYVEAYSNRANILSDLGRHPEAVADYRQAVALDPEFAIARFNLSMCLLRLGRFEEGWREYEWRKRADRKLAARPYPQPVWTGQQPAAGKTIFVYAEQGLGDTLQFCRYAALLAAQGADVVVAAQASLHGLLATLDPKVTVIGEGETPGRFDVHTPMLSLPLAFATDLETIPAPPRYLFADAALRSGWAARLGPKTRPRIGVVWSGSRVHKNDANRSIPFGPFSAILREDADWAALQNELRPADADLLAGAGVGYFGEALKTFSDTAALIDQLDLVITVDTSVAHLAGAMGKPVWILLPFNPDWRWLCDRQDSPWYPSARLFRQPTPGDWSSVLEAAKQELPLFLDDLARS